MAQFQPVTTCEHLLYTTVRLEFPLTPTEAMVGTGFFYDHRTKTGTKLPLLVTNKHVIRGSKEIKVRFHQRDATAPRWAVAGYVDLVFSLPESQWTGHPDPNIDLAAIPLRTFQQKAIPQEIAVVALSEHYIPTDLSAFDAIEEIVMIGYPSGLWDSANNYPLVRRGVTASHPGIDFNGKPQIAMDMSCFHGSSGSPVLLIYEPTRAKKVAFFDDTRLFAFLGVQFSVSQHPIPGRVIPPTPIPTPVIQTQTLIPNDVGYIIKSREVIALARHIEAAHP